MKSNMENLNVSSTVNIMVPFIISLHQKVKTSIYREVQLPRYSFASGNEGGAH